jgi:REP element-mobilizing transposase RayT
MPDHMHMFLLAIPPICAVAYAVGFIRGKSVIHIARTFMDRKRNLAGPRPRRAGTGRRVDQLNLLNWPATSRWLSESLS